MQLSLKAREDQAVEVSNQNLNYQDFKYNVSKCYLVWTDILSPQIFRIYRSRIRPYSTKRIYSPWLVLRVFKTTKSYGGQQVFFSRVQIEQINSLSDFCKVISTFVNSISSSILGYGVCAHHLDYSTIFGDHHRAILVQSGSLMDLE
jgi:hypothetical protein